MTTSTVLAYGQSGINFIWDTIHGFIFTAGGGTFIVVMLILIGVIGIGIKAIWNIFH